MLCPSCQIALWEGSGTSPALARKRLSPVIETWYEDCRIVGHVDSPAVEGNPKSVLRQKGTGMKDAESEEQFRMLQREIVLAGEAVEALKRDQRAAIDTLRLDVAVLQHCLLQFHPDLATHFETIRDTLGHEIDPEAS